MTKKFFTVALCLCLAAGAFAQYSGGDGTVNDPYLISTKADMEALATAVNGGTNYTGKYFLLTADLTGITTIIGLEYARPFKGNFDGGGHVLNVTIRTDGHSAGVFGVAENATIKNLGVAGSIEGTFTMTDAMAGGICGEYRGVSITDCYNTASVSAIVAGSVGSAVAGGICGYELTGSSSSIINCYNTGDIFASMPPTSTSGFSAAGGICGTSSATISNCYNTGSVTVSSPNYVRSAGGICGQAAAASISNCYNTGSVTAADADGTAYYFSCGGICGTLGGPVNNCYNTGSVTAAGETTSYIGGICGNAFTAGSSIINCYNTGDIATSTTSSTSGSGGICGSNSGSITNCFAANASVTATEGAESRIAGKNYTTLTNNYALSGMLVNGETVSSADADGQEGADTDMASFQSLDWLKSPLGWDMDDDWYVPGDGGFLELRANPELRLVLSSNAVTYGDDAQTVYSSPAWAPVVYSSSDNTIAEVVSGLIQIKRVGTVTIWVTRAGTSSYAPAKVGATLTINKAPLTITAKSETMTYGGTLPVAYTCEYSGFVNNEDETTTGVLSNLPTVNCTATATDNAGDYPITVSGATADNYDITHNSGTLTIDKKSLTVTPDNASREYGENNPTFTVTYSNDFVNGDDAGDINIPPQASCTATVLSNVGNHTITVTGGVADNYDFIYDTGTLEITKAPLEIKTNNLSRAYGVVNPVFTFSYNGFKNSDNETVLNNLAAACGATVASGVGPYPITFSVDPPTNYAITPVYGELSVTPATLVVTAKPVSRTYGDANPVFELSYTGFVNGNNETVLLTRPQADCVATPASGAGNYTIYVSGGSAANYSLVHTNGTLTISKATLTVSGYDANRNYGESNPTFSFVYSGFKNGDNEYSLTTRPQANCTATATSNVGYYSINISGGVAANYDFAYYPGFLFINKAPLTVTANDATRPRGEDNPASSLSYSGFRNNETESVLDVLPTISCVAEKTAPTGFYDILLSGGSDNNYNYSLINGRLEVTSPTGIEAVAASGVSVYPNPVRHDMYVRSASPVEKIEIYNQAGILVLVDRICSGKTDVSQLAAGVHFVRVYVKGKVETR